MSTLTTAAGIRLAAARILLRGLAALPLPAIHAAGGALGGLLRFLPWRKKAVIAANLALCFPELDPGARARLLAANLRSTARMALESGAAWYWSRKRLVGHVRELEGWDHLEKALAAGRGVLLAGAHLGNWEVLSLYVSARLPVVYLYKPPADTPLDQALTRNRARFGGELIAAGSPAMRRLIRHLRAGRAVGLLCDQQPKQGEGVFAPLFGRPALTMTLPGRLARQTGCPVLVASCLRLPRGGGWKIVIEPAGESIAGPDPKRAAAELNRMVERAVRRAPEQYLWLYKRFALQPDGLANPYTAGPNAPAGNRGRFRTGA